MCTQHVALHQWVPMVETLGPPKKGCGQSRYVGIYYSFVKHKEGSHPMYMGDWICTCEIYAQLSY